MYVLKVIIRIFWYGGNFDKFKWKNCNLKLNNMENLSVNF